MLLPLQRRGGRSWGGQDSNQRVFLRQAASQFDNNSVRILESQKVQVSEARAILRFIGGWKNLGAELLQAGRHCCGIVTRDANAEMIHFRRLAGFHSLNS